MKKNKTMIAAFALPATILFVLIFVYPVIRTVFMSFFSIQEITDSFSSWVFNGIDNYKALMGNALYRTSWINLLKIFFLGGAITLGVSLLLAAILKSGVKLKGFWQAVIYMPNIISAVAMATMLTLPSLSETSKITPSPSFVFSWSPKSRRPFISTPAALAARSFTPFTSVT